VIRSRQRVKNLLKRLSSAVNIKRGLDTFVRIMKYKIQLYIYIYFLIIICFL